MKRFLPILLLLVTGCAGVQHKQLKFTERDYYNVPTFVTDSELQGSDGTDGIYVEDITTMPLGSNVACTVMFEAPSTEVTLHVGERLDPLKLMAWVQVEGVLLSRSFEAPKPGVGWQPGDGGSMLLLANFPSGLKPIVLQYEDVSFCLTPEK